MGLGFVKRQITQRAEIPQRRWDAWVMYLTIAWFSWLGRVLPLGRVLLRAEIGMTRLVGLFDRDHYLSQIRPEALCGMNAVEHYVRHGDAAGLSPSPLFDVAHYDKHCGRRFGLNRLLHYALVAHFRWRSPTPWFDPQYYLRRNPDVQGSAIQAVWHFQCYGWRESRSPLPGLDIRKALHTLAALRPVKGSLLSLLRTEDILRLHRLPGGPAGLAHHLLDETERGLGSGAEGEASLSGFWADVHPPVSGLPVQVEVVLNITTPLPQTLECLRRLLSTTQRASWRLRVIHDELADSDTAAWLRSLAARDLIEWLQPVDVPVASGSGGAARAQGAQDMVDTAVAAQQFRHALEQPGEHDLVLLDSHVLVQGDWLDRLARHIAAVPDLAALTTLSDDGSVVAYPEMFTPASVPLERPAAEIDSLAAKVNSGGMVRLPALLTPGCLYLRRAALRDAGLPRERAMAGLHSRLAGVFWDDLWERLQARGWDSAVACDVFLGRQRLPGAVEALSSTQAPATAGVLDPQLSDFIASDPLLPWRARIDLARLGCMCRQRNALLVCHSRGGGTERHLLESTEQLVAQGWGVFELRPVAHTRAVSLRHIGLFGLPNLGHIPLDDTQVLAEVLALLRITELHIHHLIDFPPDALVQFMGLAQRLDLAVHVAVHDYYLVCPRVNMVSPSGQFCGEPDETACDRCLHTDTLGRQVPSIREWRGMWMPLLQAARRVVAPTADAARRLQTLLPGEVPLVVQPHEAPPPSGLTQIRPRLPGECLRVLVIGAIGRIKGFDSLLGVAREVQRQGLALELALLGFSPDDGRLASAGVKLLGPYFDADLPGRIIDQAPHLIWIPSIWPETYCYVLSAALRSGCQVAVFDLGAQAERAREHDIRHLCLPLSLASQPGELARHLLAHSLCAARPD